MDRDLPSSCRIVKLQSSSLRSSATALSKTGHGCPAMLFPAERWMMQVLASRRTLAPGGFSGWGAGVLPWQKYNKPRPSQPVCSASGQRVCWRLRLVREAVSRTRLRPLPDWRLLWNALGQPVLEKTTRTLPHIDLHRRRLGVARPMPPRTSACALSPMGACRECVSAQRW